MPPKKKPSKPSEPSSDEDAATDRGDVTGEPIPETSEAPPVATEQEASAAVAPKGDNAANDPILGAPLKNSEQRRKIALERIKRFSETLTVEPLVEQSECLLRTRLSLLSDEWLKFIAAHDEVAQKAMTWAGDQENLELYDQASVMYANCIEIITRNIERLKTEAKNHDRAPNPHNQGLLTNSLNLKLEPIRIPVFNGAKENWVLFRDQFIALVHDNEQMTDAVKMHQLFTHITDKAMRVIKGITPSGSNYNKAWQVLNERFNNNQMLINHHLKRFFNLPPLTRDDPSRLTVVVDGVNELINSLPGLGEQMNTWDSIISFCVFNKLDHASQEAWKTQSKSNEIKPLHEFLSFLEQRAQTDETTNSSLLVGSAPKTDFKKKKSVFHVVPITNKPKSSNRTGKSKASINLATTAETRSCKLCPGQEHPLFRCMKFRNMAVKDRVTEAHHEKVCLRCLSTHKPDFKCAFDSCPVCSKPHNRLLCYEDEKRRQEVTNSQPAQASVNHLFLNGSSTALLATAEVKILNTISYFNHLRCLCDNGSQLNLITDEAVKKLKLPRSNAKIQLNGIGGVVTGKSLGIVKLRVASLYNGKEYLDAVFFIVKQVTLPLPLVKIRTNWLAPKPKMDLADPNFNTPGPVEALLGVNFWAQMIKPEIKRFEEHIVAQNSKLGWLIFGSATPKVREVSKRSYLTAVLTQEPVDGVLTSLAQFWEQEEPPTKKFKTADEIQCEENFIATHYRTSNGRYGVRLPFRESVEVLGDSFQTARKQFLALERRLSLNPLLKEKYIGFMREYMNLGHMSLAQNDDSGYYTPHHCVLTAKKFRTVFNASSTTTTGYSLNDVQLIGEQLQTKLSLLLIKFRCFAVALTADIVKMYRQIEVHPADRKYQRILWREKESDELLTYELNTVTYGQAAAPHCAVRALQQCAIDNGELYPTGAAHVLNHFYMDDYIGGADTVEQVIQIKSELEQILKLGGFELAKWCSNEYQIFDWISPNENMTQGVLIDDFEMKSVLGLHWLPYEDIFTFRVQPVDQREVWTKRQILSEIGRLYDPNGFLAPITIVAKILIQQIWISGQDWDEPVKPTMLERWKRFLSNLSSLSSFKIPRWLGMYSHTKSQLHGFCDASQEAYAAVVYVRTLQPDGTIRVQLVQAKTRVAPLSKPLTIPRMELSGALLLANLVESMNEAIGDKIESYHYWCDSQVTLRWIKKDPSELKIFVANRVAQIKEKTNIDSWNYVPTDSNPADRATRGQQSEEPYDHAFWLQGPSWLKESTDMWPKWCVESSEEIENITNEEIKRSVEVLVQTNTVPTAVVSILTTHSSESPPNLPRQGVDVVEAYSSFDKIISVIAYVLRAKERFARKGLKEVVDLGGAMLTPEERHSALRLALQSEQSKHLASEIESVLQNNLQKRSKVYKKLTLFITPSDNLLRLNGRLRNQELAFDYKFPIILPPHSTLTQRLMEKAHAVTLHGGAQQMLQYTRQKFWIPRDRQLAKSVIDACPECIRQNPPVSEQLMAPLPTMRTTAGLAWQNVGVDYCGPVYLKPQAGRCNITLKAYICVFVCMTSRAVHLELVSDLTTAAFIAALRRFVSRRGPISLIYSDHGTNFVGASNEIIKIKKHLQMLSFYPFAREFNLQWKFTTERASHHGGIFEAAVKSAKKHLVRCIGEQRLTYEEYCTILTQVEACLNSRPITKLNDDPQDESFLTPGHLVSGRQLIAFPEEMDLKEIPSNRLNRWQLIQQITQNFWKKWSEEYLHSLINRPKWSTQRRNFQLNDVVLIKEDNLPPTQWKMGRVAGLVFGSDINIRTVILKTATGEYRRPITKLALLVPAESEDPHNSDCEANSTPPVSEQTSSDTTVDNDLDEAQQASSGAGCSHW